MDNNIKEHILDYTVGDADYWKRMFNQCLDEIKELNGAKLVKHFFLDTWRGFSYWDEAVNNMLEHIQHHKFKHLVLINSFKVLGKSRWWWSDRHNQFWYHPDVNELMWKIELAIPAKYQHCLYKSEVIFVLSTRRVNPFFISGFRGSFG